MAIRYRPLPFGPEGSTIGSRDFREVTSDEPIAMGRKVRRLYEKMLKAEGRSCRSSSKKKKKGKGGKSKVNNSWVTQDKKMPQNENKSPRRGIWNFY